MYKKVHYIPDAPYKKTVCDVDLIDSTGVSSTGVGTTDQPGAVRGCEVCLEAAAEDLADVDGEHSSSCRYCGQTISVTGGVAWRRAIHSPCPKCQHDGMVPDHPMNTTGTPNPDLDCRVLVSESWVG